MNLSIYFCTVLKYVKGHTTFNFSSFMTEDKDLSSRILLFQDCVSVWIDFQSFLTEETDVKGIKVRLNLALRFYKRNGRNSKENLSFSFLTLDPIVITNHTRSTLGLAPGCQSKGNPDCCQD